ncbi:MAG: hypothetical protein UT60_C0036G0001, partial [candidate division CPR2 bacterium GW2011_GWD2_39_7]
MSLKDKYDLVKKAKELQKKLRAEVVEVNAGAVNIVINGEQKVQSVNIDSPLDIGTNKLLLLNLNQEAKDYVDLYFLL